MDHAHHDEGPPSFWRSRLGIGWVVLAAVAGWFLWTEHRAHLLGFGPSWCNRIAFGRTLTQEWGCFMTDTPKTARHAIVCVQGEACVPRMNGGGMAGRIEGRLKELGETLPTAAAPVANYVATRQIGELLFVSGQISRTADGSLIAGKLGADLDVAAGKAAARQCGLAILAQAKAALGDLDRIEAVIKLTGFVNCTADFKDQPAVVNGCSDLLVAVLGEAGRHTRSAVGSNALPMNAAVEVEAILAVAKA